MTGLQAFWFAFSITAGIMGGIGWSLVAGFIVAGLITGIIRFVKEVLD